IMISNTQKFIYIIYANSAKKFIIFPNNKNIILAAKQTTEIVDNPFKVVQSRSVLEGLSGIFAFNPDMDLEDNVTDMEENISSVKSGQVTIAVRDTTLN